VLLAALSLILVATLVMQSRRLGRIDRRLGHLTQGQDGRNLDTILEAHLDKVLEVSRALDELTARAAVLEANGRQALQQVGLVRFNPFADTGGNQSFALALLDARDDGFIISSLHTRSSTRIYARSLVGGRAEGGLSDEETQAVAMARSAPPGRAGLADRAPETVPPSGVTGDTRAEPADGAAAETGVTTDA